MAFAALTLGLGHLIGPRPIGVVAVANDTILAVSYAVALAILTAARRLAQQMTTLTQEAADAKRVHDTLFLRGLEHDPAWEIDVVHLPLRGVGGDYFYAGRRPGGTMAFVADVSGKGVQAAMLLAVLKSLCDGTTGPDIGPRATLGRFNRALHGVSSDEMFATAWLVMLEEQGGVHYASAGHEPAFVQRPGEPVRLLDGGGRPLGVESDNHAAEFAVKLEPGETIVVYSDGITDLLERRKLRVEDLFDDFSGLKQRLPTTPRRDDVLALRISYQGSDFASRAATAAAPPP